MDQPLVKFVLHHRDFAGVHFTGSTGVFNHMWKTIGENVANYKTYPRIVGETGGKDFVIAHKTADPDVVATHCCAVLLNTRDKNVLLHQGLIFLPTLQMK